MQHYDEHTLELFVLGSGKVSSRNAEIRAHLAECHGCRALVEELQALHADLANALEVEDVPHSSEKALAALEHRMTHYSEHYSAPARFTPRTPMQKMRYFIVKYPMAAAVAGISFALIFIGLGALLTVPFKTTSAGTPPAITDWNPAFCVENQDDVTLEVYNKDDELLWKAKLAGSSKVLLDRRDEGFTTSVVADLQGDGVSEVISVARFAGDTEIGARSLRIFDGRRAVILDTLFVENVPHKDFSYSRQIDVNNFVVRSARESGKSELIISANSWGRSPRLLLRLNDRYEVVGRYWHFGDLAKLLLRDVDGDGDQELLATGQNDVNGEATLGQFAVAVLLDPDKITGEKRSTACRNLLLEDSDAEICYMRFPSTNIDSAMSTHSVGFKFTESVKDRFVVAVGMMSAYFYYFLADDMKVIAVRSSDAINWLYAKNVKEGRLSGAIDDAYLNRLKESVRYWNGRQWRKEVVKVQAQRTMP